VIVKDFGRAFEHDFFDDIQETLAPLDVAILINNVGHRTGWKPFHESPTTSIRETIACGTMVQTRLTHVLLPQMLKRLDTNTQCRSAIVFITAQCMHPNTGLAAAGLYSNEISVPYLATYEASNAYGFYNACSLIKEYENVERMDMLNITPGAVITENTAHTLQDAPFSVSAKDFVFNILRFLGGNVRNGTMCAHWGHALSNALIGLVPFKKDSMLQQVGDNIATDYMKRYQAQQNKYREFVLPTEI
jgi:NAD(P)-dependent dehydrogenase (short-subunit alcohol dehydrogenase family)